MFAYPSALNALEIESIEIFSEKKASFRKPVMLFSIGEGSSVLLHLARRAFATRPIPFLMHINNNWKFKEMISFRDETAKERGFRLLVKTIRDGIRECITSFSMGASGYTTIMKTVALRAGFDRRGFDFTTGDSRRGEERRCAKKGILPAREPGHRWGPRSQRLESWKTLSPKLAPNQTIRLLPKRDWTEPDVWNYILQENFKVSPLYFATERPTVWRETR